MESYSHICVQTLLLSFFIASLITGDVSLANLSCSNTNSYTLCESQICEDAGILITESIKPSVHPCHNFYEHACGGWMEKNPATEKLGTYSQINKLDDVVISQLKELLETYNTSDIEAVRKAKDLYHSCLDLTAIEEVGISPLKSMVSSNGGWPLTIASKVWNLKSQKLTLQSIYQNYITMGAREPLFLIRVKRDENDPNNNILSIDLQPTIEDTQNPAYIHYIEEVVDEFVDNGVNGSNTFKEDVENMLKFGTALAVLYNSSSRVYQKMTIEELQRSWNTAVLDRSDYAINWVEIIHSYFDGTGIVINLTEKIEIPFPNFVQEFVHLLKKTQLRTIVNYIQWFEINDLLSFTKRKMRNVTDKILPKTVDLQGINDRITFCIKQNGMRHALSYMFVQKYFSQELLYTITDMVSNILSEMKKEIDEFSWMDSDAKIQSKEKVDSMVKHIGYPSWYNEVGKMDAYYVTLKIGKNFFENILNIRKFQRMRTFRDFYKQFDEIEFEIPAIEIDSAYNAERNLLDYPAVLFQMPFFHHNLPVAMQYGGMGSAIANEIVNGFYFEGREFDKYGDKKELWAKSTVASFNEKAECFVRKFSKYVLLKNCNNSTVYVNGERTQKHDIADTTGFSISIKAYLAYRNKNKLKDVRIPGLPNVTDKQLFFYSLANLFCTSYTPKYIIDVLETVNSVRISGALSNIKQFAKAFNCPMGGPMNPRKKCSI